MNDLGERDIRKEELDKSTHVSFTISEGCVVVEGVCFLLVVVMDVSSRIAAHIEINEIS